MSKKKRKYADPTAEVAEGQEQEILDDFDHEEEKEGIMKKTCGFFKKHGKTILVGAGALAAGLLLGGRRRKDNDDDSEYNDDEYYEEDSEFDEVNPVTEDAAD